MKHRLRSARLELRTFEEEDAASLHAMFSDPETNTIGTGPFTSLSQTRRWNQNRAAAMQDLQLAWYAVILRDAGTLVGNCGTLVGRMTPAEPELGYMISHRALLVHLGVVDAQADALDHAAGGDVGRADRCPHPAYASALTFQQHGARCHSRVTLSLVALLYYTRWLLRDREQAAV
jgi:hypothetical protein